MSAPRPVLLLDLGGVLADLGDPVAAMGLDMTLPRVLGRLDLVTDRARARDGSDERGRVFAGDPGGIGLLR